MRTQLCLDLSVRQTLSEVGSHDARPHLLGGEREDSEVLWAPLPKRLGYLRDWKGGGGGWSEVAGFPCWESCDQGCRPEWFIKMKYPSFPILDAECPSFNTGLLP